MFDKPEYYLGYPKYVLQMQKIRRVEYNAAFLLPYLRDGMSLLDCGCGLGSITNGFARFLPNGKVVGIDTENFLLNMAREDAAQKGLKNVHYQLGNILKLPFPDNSFDVVFEHALFTYLSPYKEIALKEMLRVVKSGGIIASREHDIDTMIFYPDSKILSEAMALRKIMYEEAEADLRMGRKLKYLYSDPRLQSFIISSSSLVTFNQMLINAASTYLSQELIDSIFIGRLVKTKVVTPSQIDRYRQEWIAFKDMRGAYLQYSWTEALGYKK
jgi:ubiquinone/menaquinone biosynthesis C-methylase UbiE